MREQVRTASSRRSPISYPTKQETTRRPEVLAQTPADPGGPGVRREIGYASLRPGAEGELSAMKTWLQNHGLGPENRVESERAGPSIRAIGLRTGRSELRLRVI